MSSFLSPVAQFPMLLKDDKSTLWQYDAEDSWNGLTYSWQDMLWPRSRIPSQGMGVSGRPSDILSTAYTHWWWATRTGGATERWQVFGQCLDQNTNPVANATVSLYDHTLGVIVDNQTSDSNGGYKVGAVYGSGRSFVVAYKTGSPDIAGTSSDILP
jgi:hypothetical protein